MAMKSKAQLRQELIRAKKQIRELEVAGKDAEDREYIVRLLTNENKDLKEKLKTRKTSRKSCLPSTTCWLPNCGSASDSSKRSTWRWRSCTPIRTC